MKKTVLFLGTLLMVVTLLLTGCGGTKQAGAGVQDVVNKAAVATADNKTSAPLSTADQSQDSKNQAVSSQTVENTPQAEAPKNTDNAKPAETKTAETKTAENTSATNQSSGSADQDKGNAAVAAASSSASAPAPAPAAQKTVTVAINCQMAVNKGLAQQEKFKGVVPADGVILAPVTVELKDNESAFDILRSVVREKKILMDYEGSKGTPYVKGINNLYEFDGGPLSGWMFCVNKSYAKVGSAEYKLKPGDAIEWNYTCDLGKDLGQDWLKDSK